MSLCLHTDLLQGLGWAPLCTRGILAGIFQSSSRGRGSRDQRISTQLNTSTVYTAIIYFILNVHHNFIINFQFILHVYKESG